MAVLPKTGITLLNNQRGYVHLEPPVFICTVVLIGVDIAARKQRFRAASLLPRMMSANNGQGREPTRRSAMPSPLPPDRDDVPFPSSFGIAPPTATAVVGDRHRSLVIVLLLRIVATIFLSSSSHPKERQSQIVKLLRGGQHTNANPRWWKSSEEGNIRRRRWPGAFVFILIVVAVIVAVFITVAAAAFSWLLFVVAPAISVAAGVFVATAVGSGSAAAAAAAKLPAAALLPSYRHRCRRLRRRASSSPSQL
jgi:hypothetical protein